MASLYNLEPQPTAKVILNTTSGDILLELFGKQAPLATRNFLQHCLDNYYTNTIFHRLVPGFIIQGGDPTGTGSGGISALNDGEPFQDEFHSRLKFNRRGLLGMANEGRDSNGSQFFLSLGATPELQGKHTMFGRVEGETIYNLIKMGDAELTEGEGSEKPMYPTRITGSEVLVNPFEGMEARVREAPRTREEKGGKDVKKRKKPAGKNVLSFGGDEGEEEVAPVVKKAKANPKMVAIEAEDEAKAPVEKKSKVERRRKPPTPVVEAPVVQQPVKPTPAAALVDDDSDDEPAEPILAKQSALDKTNAEIAALKASMKRTTATAPTESSKPMSALEAMIPATSTRARKRGGKATDEKGSLDLFNAWKNKLDSTPSTSNPNGSHTTQPTSSANGTSAANDDEEAELCDLHFIANCQSCKSWDDEGDNEGEKEDDDGDLGWMSHSLVAVKDKMGKDLEWKKKMEEIEVIDPREKAREIREEGRRGKGRERERERERDGGRREGGRNGARDRR